MNRYAYALDDPTSRVDPSGFSAASLFDGAGGYSYSGTNFYFIVPSRSTVPSGWDVAVGAAKGFGSKLWQKGVGLVTGTISTVVSLGQYCVSHATDTVFGIVSPGLGCAVSGARDIYANRNAIGRSIAYGLADYVRKGGDDLVSGDPERIAAVVTEVFFDVGSLGALKMPTGGLTAVTKARVVGPPAELVAGRTFEANVLKDAGLVKFAGAAWRPTAEQIQSAAFKLIVGEAKYTKGGQLTGVLPDAVGLEIKSGASTLGTSYQLRLLTYRALLTREPLMLLTTRPLVSSFEAWLQRWGVSVTRQ
jgi:hypothetical protein